MWLYQNERTHQNTYTICKMKIGILTYFTDIPYFNDTNPGMDLQAFGVYTAIKDTYPNAHIEFIRYHSWRGMWRPFITRATPKSLWMDIVQFKKYYNFTKTFPLSNRHLVEMDYTKSCEFINSLGYDAIYVGSDTLLELFRAPQGNITAYWLSPEVKSKKFMIAASARDTSYGKLTNKQKTLMTASVEDFSALGIRDAATYSLIQSLLKDKQDTRLEIIPDPTFYLKTDYTEADRYAKRKGIANCGKPIVCFHFRARESFEPELARIYHEAGYLIASLRPTPYCDLLLKDLSPMEFAGIFKYFTVTITHRFHDSVFNIKNLTPVVVYPPSKAYINENGDSKQSSLMKAFGIYDCCYVDDPAEIGAKGLKEKADKAINIFKEKKEVIEMTLDRYRRDFSNYVYKTSKL